jgi:hypothetical protein
MPAGYAGIRFEHVGIKDGCDEDGSTDGARPVTAISESVRRLLPGGQNRIERETSYGLHV